MISPIDILFDEIPLSPQGSVDATDFYDSYLKCGELAGRLPKQLMGTEPELAFYRMLQDVHPTKSTNSAFFRKKSDASEALKTLWLSKARQTARIFVALNDLPRFQGLTSEDISRVAKLSTDVSNLPKLASVLLSFGIVLLYERSLPGMKLDGAVFNVAPDRPVIALSLRYPRLDSFWFTLMHELAHVVLHRDKLDIPILDDLDEHNDDMLERQANRLAGNSLISRSNWRSCMSMYDQSDEAVIKFASQVGVHPAIVAGRMRRELNRHDIFSNFINEINVRKELLNDE
jgi:HTH-type transcriptional regulator/antitoxin HigA